MNAKIEIALDVGHSSIGWAVLRRTDILGCGTVIFRADDCLASSRRAYRRQRRHIRSTKQRIVRIKMLLRQLGVLTEAQLNQTVCSSPWHLAARVLQNGKLLTWLELWDVLRWYAHNRGYDGNRRWSATETEMHKDDSEKEENARTLMDKHGAQSMAETFCKELGIDPLGKKQSSMRRFKGLNAAFPRDIVEREIRNILRAHVNKLKNVDANLEKVLFSDWRAITCPDLKLPERYEGGLLFGQLVPRFDNRIIATCPITYQKIYAQEFAATGDSRTASKKAKVLAKVPSRNCREFLEFRWAMQLANIRVGKFKDRELRPLSADERRALDKRMREHGYLTPKELKDVTRSLTACERDNLDTMMTHPDAKDALLLDPIQKLISSDEFRTFWKLLPERMQKRIRGQWLRGKIFSLAQIREQCQTWGDVSSLDSELQKQLGSLNSKVSKKEKQITLSEFLQKRFPPRPLRMDGRAPFARPLLKQAYEDVLAGKTHPKENGGCLFVSNEILQTQLNNAIAKQTNNHLIRHRLLILERLLVDIVEEYGEGKKESVSKITIEVNRDLREMSGKTAKEKAQDLGLRIANHHAVAEKIEKAFAEERNGKNIPITAGLIRKARVAEDLEWTCPYTGHTYEPKHLLNRNYVDKDHVIPRSSRASDGLDSLVVTFSEINKWKGNRTAWQFVSDEQGKPVPGLPNLSIMSLSRYKQFVESLETYKGHDDDKRRKKRRKELLLLPKYEEKEFVPRDLTQTSQLVRLGAQALKRIFANCEQKPPIISLPGSVTGAVRKAWRALGCLSLANPQILDENGDVKTKTDIRGITHLHHALDACVLGLASHYIPNNGRVWEIIIKRHPSDLEKRQLLALGVFGTNAENRIVMRDLDSAIKEQIRQRLAEKRVVQHIPARMDGLRVEQNAWRVVTVKDGDVTIQQRIRQPDGTRPVKRTEEKAAKLLGLMPNNVTGKLKANKCVLVIPDNYGVALDPKPTIIPFHKVFPRLREIKRANHGKMPRVVRNGQIIRVAGGKNFRGIWKVFSAKNNATGVALDIGSPDVVRLRNKTAGHKINVRLSTLIADGLEIVKAPLTGIAVSSATAER